MTLIRVGSRESRAASLPLLVLLLVASAPLPLAASSRGSGEPIAAKSKARKQTKTQRLRRNLHRNLDGKGDGFIAGWRWEGNAFTLIIDRRLYAPNKLLAAAMTARSIFDVDGVVVPKTLVIRDVSGEVLDREPFANVPALIK